jgi:predicted Fe-S protein YdhL (DUF1289 family)
MRLTDLMTAPPGGWRYRQPETDFWCMAITFSDLARKVAMHRANNKLPVVAQGFESVEAEIEHAICQTLTEESKKRLCVQRNRVNVARPGDVFSAVIHTITGRHALTCGVCQQRMKKMNDWKWFGCWRHRQEIIGWLQEEAAKRGHRITNDAALSLLKAALKEIHTRAKSPK